MPLLIRVWNDLFYPCTEVEYKSYIYIYIYSDFFLFLFINLFYFFFILLLSSFFSECSTMQIVRD